MYPENCYKYGFDNVDGKGPIQKNTFIDARVINPNVEVIKSLDPDLIVGDYFSQYPLLVADECQVPIVVNMPTSLELVSMQCLHSIKGADQSCACCGCLCFLPTLAQTMISYAMSDK